MIIAWLNLSSAAGETELSSTNRVLWFINSKKQSKNTKFLLRVVQGFLLKSFKETPTNALSRDKEWRNALDSCTRSGSSSCQSSRQGENSLPMASLGILNNDPIETVATP